MGKSSLSFLFIFSLFLVLPLLSASYGYDNTIDPIIYKQYNEAVILQTCANCTSLNITSLTNANGTIILQNVPMTKNGESFNYTVDSSLITELGLSHVNGVGNPNGVNTIWSYPIQVTSTGISLNSVLENPLLIIMLFIALLFLVTGIIFKDSSLGFIGSIFLILLGIYITIYGLNLINDFYTQSVGIAMIGFGFILMSLAAYEWIPWDKIKGDD